MFVLRVVFQRGTFGRGLEILAACFAYYRLCGLILEDERALA